MVGLLDYGRNHQWACSTTDKTLSLRPTDTTRARVEHYSGHTVTDYSDYGISVTGWLWQLLARVAGSTAESFLKRKGKELSRYLPSMKSMKGIRRKENGGK